MKYLLLVLIMSAGDAYRQPYIDDKLYESVSECFSSFSKMGWKKPEKGYIIGVCIPADQYRVAVPDQYDEPEEK